MKTDKEIWEETFSNKEEVDKFNIKHGPPLTEEQIQKRKEQLEKQKLENIIESLQDQINILKESIKRIEKVFRNNLQTKKLKPQTIEVNNESKTTKKQTE